MSNNLTTVGSGELATLNPDAIAGIIQSAPSVLTSNKELAQKAEDAGRDLLSRIPEIKTDDEDKQFNDYLVKVRTASERLAERRKPITQIFDAVKKEFTSLESRLDPKTVNGIYSEIQARRDAYAKIKIEIQRKAEAEARTKMEADKERVSIKAELTTLLNEHFHNHRQIALRTLTETFNALTIENKAETANMIRLYQSTYQRAHFNSFAPRVVPLYLAEAEVLEIKEIAMSNKYGEFAEEFKTAVEELRSELIDKIPGRVAELEEIRKAEEERKAAEQKAKEAKDTASKAEAERQVKEAEARAKAMEAEATARQEAERIEAEKKAEEKRRSDATAVEATRAAETTATIFDSQVQQATIAQDQAQVRESLEIEILNSVGWLQIIQFYFEKEGAKKSPAELEKKTLGSMKKFCETWAHKHDERIQSQFLKYTDKVKAVASK